MRNVAVSYGESIFEPFWDCGESYPNHQKYCVLEHYDIEKYNDTVNIKVEWVGISVSVIKKSDLPYDVKMTAQCNIDVSEYDNFRFFGYIPKDMTVKAELLIDGKIQSVEMEGVGITDEYLGKISGKTMTAFSLSFKSYSDLQSTSLYFAGFLNSERVEYMNNQKSPYDENWEGCFVENPEIKTEKQIYFDDEELKALRERVKKKPYSDIYGELRKKAEEAMSIVPEEYIGKYIAHTDRRWVIKRDIKKTVTEEMQNLAFVGIIEERLDMLRLACRMALSISHNEYWHESIMGKFPGATWHHRCFTEEGALRACAIVLDWAGSLLTWHGKHIILDAIIMKGLPRMESDFMTVDYIREMNQGIVFCSGRIPALIACAKTYPRYEKRVIEAEEDMLEMIDNYFLEDGGNPEGPSYWNYTLSMSLPILYIMARRRNVPLWDIMPEKLKKSVEYQLSCMSDEDDGTKMLPINDSHGTRNSPIISGIYSQFDNRWQDIYLKTLKAGEGAGREFLIMVPDTEREREDMYKESFINMPLTGHTSVRRKFAGDGIAHLHTVSGKTYFGHCHGDKGSFILELDKEPVFVDRGVCDYCVAYREIENTDMHNTFAPYEEGKVITQPKYNVLGGVVTKSELKGEVYNYATDLTPAWEDGMFKNITREIYSDRSDNYVITDTMSAKKSYAMCFRLNTYGEIKVFEDHALVETDKHRVYVYFDSNKLSKVIAGEYGFDCHMNSVNQLGIYYEASDDIKIVTRIKCERK